MARGFHGKVHLGRSANFDMFLPHLGIHPSSLHQILSGVLKLEGLQVDVLDVGAGVRHSPGDVLVVPDDDQRSPWQADAGRVQLRRLQLNLIPNTRNAVAQVGIIDQQRLAGARMRSTENPVVAAKSEIRLLVAREKSGERGVEAREILRMWPCRGLHWADWRVPQSGRSRRKTGRKTGKNSRDQCTRSVGMCHLDWPV